MTDKKTAGTIAMRREAMSVLGQTPVTDIATRIAAVSLPVHRRLRESESGLVMVRGRIGGDGAPFNLGEATVARAAVRLASGEIGFGYTLGRDIKKAEAIALCDALIQTDDYCAVIETQVLAPLRAKLEAERLRKAAETAATRVDFYTLVRGES